MGWVTGQVAVVRFYGRNVIGWEARGDRETRYDYGYNLLELAEWLPKIEEMAARATMTLALFHTFPRGQAVEAARQLQEPCALRLVLPTNSGPRS